MNGDETCTCGDVFDEHDQDAPHVCEIAGCDCVGFEEAEGDEVEEL